MKGMEGCNCNEEGERSEKCLGDVRQQQIGMRNAGENELTGFYEALTTSADGMEVRRRTWARDREQIFDALLFLPSNK